MSDSRYHRARSLRLPPCGRISPAAIHVAVYLMHVVVHLMHVAVYLMHVAVHLMPIVVYLMHVVVYLMHVVVYGSRRRRCPPPAGSSRPSSGCSPGESPLAPLAPPRSLAATCTRTDAIFFPPRALVPASLAATRTCVSCAGLLVACLKSAISRAVGDRKPFCGRVCV